MTPDPDENKLAILLLCSSFGAHDSDARPLSVAEFNKLEGWLRAANLRPRDLLDPAARDTFLSETTTPEHAERIRRLSERGFMMSHALERWGQRGIWAVTRAEERYPARIRRRLAQQAAPVFYGVGDPELLARPALAVAGSRDADEHALAYACALGGRAADEELAVVTGGARGVDRAAIQGCLERAGAACAVLVAGLYSAAVAAHNREMIADGRLALISPFHPEAGFTAGNAMARNRYVYALADWSVIVRSELAGGTWSGGTELLKHGWSSLFVRASEDEGNRALLERGALPIPAELDEIDRLRTLFERTSSARAAPVRGHRSKPPASGEQLTLDS
ncbi:MAG: hypothetical protein MAG453_00771 [Calditrichaeota bacterium]|nr:hypothetical protein [Calditrichota bacterium]